MGQIFTASCNSDARLDGKTVVITGANTGIGKETAKDLYIRGGKIILACRNITKANEAVEDIKKQCQGKENLGELEVIELDLSKLSSVRTCADELLRNEEQINILINNGGVFGMPYKKTEDGFESTMGTNHFGHFLFTLLLLPKIIKSTPARIVTVSSKMHSMTRGLKFDDLDFDKRRYGSMIAYNESKLANILFSKELANQLRENNIEGVNTYSLHPGVVSTEVARNLNESYSRAFQWVWAGLMSVFGKNATQGAQTTIYCSVDAKCAKETGLYYSECAVTRTSRAALNEENAKKLWDISWKAVGLEESYDPFGIIVPSAPSAISRTPLSAVSRRT